MTQPTRSRASRPAERAPIPFSRVSVCAGAYAAVADTLRSGWLTTGDQVEGALGADIWTWGQPYRGVVVHLTDPGLEPNALTRALARRRADGVLLMTHMTPSQLQEGPRPDLASALQMFRGVILAAGAG